MVETSGRVFPNRGTRTNGHSSPDAFSEVQTPRGAVRYSANLDFNRPEPLNVAMGGERRYSGVPGDAELPGIHNFDGMKPTIDKTDPAEAARLDRNDLWAKIKTYRDAPTPENEQAMHGAMDAYEAAMKNAAPPEAGRVAQRIGDVMTRLENGVTLNKMDDVKQALLDLTDLHDEVYDYGIGGPPKGPPKAPATPPPAGPPPRSSLAETGTQVYRAGLLTNPTTSLRNIGSNTGMAGMEAVARAPAALWDRGMALVTGQRTVDFSPAASLRAGMRGAMRGLREAKGIWKGTEPAGDVASAVSKYEGRALNSGSKVVDAYVNGVYKFLQMQDRPFFWSAYEQAKAELERVSKGALDAESLEAEAINAAQYATFQNNSRLAQSAMGLRRPFGHAGEVVIPFARTPANVASAAADYSPLGLIPALTKTVRAMQKGLPAAEKFRLQRAASLAFGRAATGTSIMFLGKLMYDAGYMTGARKKTPTESQEQQLEGQQPHAIRVGNTWRSVAGISPLGTMLALGADYAESSKEPGAAALDLGAGLAGNIGTTVYDQSFLRGFNDLTTSAVQGRMGDYFRRQAGSVVPSGVRAVARVMDPTLRDPKTLGENLKASIPGLSKSVPAAIDQTGHEVKRGGGKFAPLYDITNPREDRTNEDVIRELHQYDVNVGRLAQRKGESLEGYRRRQRVEGLLWLSRMKQVIASPTFAAADSLQRQHLLDSASRAFRSMRSRRAKQLVGTP
jgi:hypothetical protein